MIRFGGYLLSNTQSTVGGGKYIHSKLVYHKQLSLGPDYFLSVYRSSIDFALEICILCHVLFRTCAVRELLLINYTHI